ncbi:MAG: ATP-binding protein [Pseudomonadota bacterium]
MQDEKREDGQETGSTPSSCPDCESGVFSLGLLADGLISVALILVPLGLLVALRRPIPQRTTVYLIAGSIVLCGVAHALHAISHFLPFGNAEIWFRTLTAVAAIGAVAGLIRLWPLLRTLPALQDLLNANTNLSREVKTRRRIELELRTAKAEIEQQVAERTSELRESEQRYRVALDGALLGVWEWDVSNGSVAYEDRNRELLGYTREEFPDTFAAWSDRVHPDDITAVLEIVQRHLETGESYRIDYRIRAASGRWHWWQSLGQATWDEAGQPIRMLGINRDITEERDREDKLKAARREAEAASVAKSAFLATMSHEIRTPMNGIIGMADLLSETELSDEQAMQVDTIIRSGEGLLTIINDVLDFSKIEAGRLTLEARSFDIADEVSAVGKLLGATAREKGIEFMVWMAPDLPHFVIGDPGRIRQVVTNLLGNAIKFTDRGSVVLGLSGKVMDREAHLVLRVSDTGPGIPEDRQKAIFAAYEQVEGPEQRRGQGTGLGLAISRRIVEAMGGVITLTSEPGKGSAFTCRFRLPIAQAVERPARRTWREALPSQSAEMLRSLMVLVAEDNATNRLLMKKLLGPLVGSLHFAENGREAVDCYRETRPDLVLMDVSMPEMDGYEATAAIRQSEAEEGRVRCPIIALTANAMQGDRERCLRAGMDDFLTKPIRRGELVEALARWSDEPGAAAVA